MKQVKPKKSLGQHFLMDQAIARRIVDSLLPLPGNPRVLEIGPGMGVLTEYLLQIPAIQLKAVDIDEESIRYLDEKFEGSGAQFLNGDFLNGDLNDYFHASFTVIGNFPYNISSQILFRMLENRELVPQLVGMFQKEVAMRICSPPRKKDYGILSVLVQAWYETEYFFTVDEHVFRPPPQVKSGVIRLTRKEGFELGAEEPLFIRVVKMAFNQRRKTLRNALKSLLNESVPADHRFLGQRAEELTWRDFTELTNLLFNST